MFFLINPINNKKILLKSIEGKKILRKYIKNYIGGMKKEELTKLQEFRMILILLILHFGCWNNNICIFDIEKMNNFIKSQQLLIYL